MNIDEKIKMAHVVMKCMNAAARLCTHHCNHAQFSRNLTIYTKKGGVSRDFMALLQTDLTTDNLKFWYEKKKRKKFYDDQRFVKERHAMLGPDLATAHFIVARGGAVKFWDIDQWFRLDSNGNHTLPDRMVQGLYLEAVDATGTQLAYTAMENFINLKYLRLLNVSDCPHVDDWFLARCYQLRDSLEILDISGCPSISEGGFSCLHHLSHLHTLNVARLPHIEFKDLTFLLLEEMLPDCDITGVGFLPRGADIAYQKLSTGSQDTLPPGSQLNISNVEGTSVQISDINKQTVIIDLNKEKEDVRETTAGKENIVPIT